MHIRQVTNKWGRFNFPPNNQVIGGHNTNFRQVVIGGHNTNFRQVDDNKWYYVPRINTLEHPDCLIANLMTLLASVFLMSIALGLVLSCRLNQSINLWFRLQ